MAEGAPLLRVYGLTLIEGSNPSLSAIKQKNRFFETGFFVSVFLYIWIDDGYKRVDSV